MNHNTPQVANGQDRPAPTMSAVCEIAARGSSIAYDILMTAKGIEGNLIGGVKDEPEQVKLDANKDKGSIGYLFDRQLEIMRMLEEASYSLIRVMQRQ